MEVRVDRDKPRILSSVFLVRSEHLNHQGHLFGGALMSEIDTIAYCLLRELLPGRTFVTRAAEIAFEHPARIGDAIRFDACLLKQGVTSAQVQVEGWVRDTRISTARMVYVHIGPNGQKAQI